METGATSRPSLPSALARSRLSVLLLPVILAASYAPLRAATFIWDDDDYVTQNLHLRTLAGLGRIWTDPSATPQYYPLTHTSFWLEYQLFGLNPLAYHIDNLLLHALSACLIVAILRRLSIQGAWLAGAVFALHPVHVESVAWVTERKNTLSGCLYLAATMIYLTYVDGAPATKRTRAAQLGVVALFVAALLSKTVACTWPVAMLLLLYYRHSRLRSQEAFWFGSLLLVGAVPAALTVHLERTQVGASWDAPLLERVASAGRALWFYPQKVLWPEPLMFEYPRWTADAGVALGTWSLALALGAVLWSLRGRLGRGPIVAALFYAVTIAPALGFTSIYPLRYAPVADHFQYLASLGPLVLAVAGATLAARRFLRFGLLRAAAASLLLLALSALTFQRAHAFKDNAALWRDSIAKNPDAWLAHHNLANELLAAQRGEEALLHARRAAELAPNPATLTTLATALGMNGDHAAAVAALERATVRFPRSALAHANLGVELSALGRFEPAERALWTAVTLAPRDARAHNNLANLLERRHASEAIEHYAAATALDPDNAAYHANYGAALQSRAQLAPAIAQFRAALALNPKLPSARNNLGVALALTGDVGGAIAQFERALADDSNDERARENLDRARQLGKRQLVR